MVKYDYDAWGRHAGGDSDLGKLNPYRYRGYYYDNETGLYFLKTRYYDPTACRFINADEVSYLDPNTINGLNLYAYCLNNPISMIDPNGTAPWWQWALSGLQLVAGIALMFVPGAQGFGVALMVSGGSMLASNIMSAAGVDGRTASIISSGLNIVAGTALLFTPFAGIGASMIGAGVGGLAGGFISESLGGSFELGAGIGSIVGSITGGQVYRAYDTYKIAQIARQGTVVIGETMTRVKVEATRIGAGHFKASIRADFVYRHGSKISKIIGESLTYSENITWIRRVAQSGVSIRDIGIHTTRVTGRSNFYIMELQRLFKYLQLG